MSVPSSPVRENASSPTSTPGSATGTAEQLTPRSKIKALLATVEDDSDGDVPTSGHPKFQLSAAEEQRPLSEPSLKSKSLREESNVDEQVLEEEEDDIVVPRGKLARRLHTSKPQKPVPDAYPEDKDQGGQARLRSPASEQYAENEHSLGEKGDGDADQAQPKKFGGFLRRKKRPYDALASPIAAELEPTSPGLGSLDGSYAGRMTGSTLPSEPLVGPDIIGDGDSDPDLPLQPMQNERFMALVARKREERKVREAAEEAKRAERAKRYQSPMESDGIESSDEDEGNLKLTQASRPTRKASKKAMEDMARETQRLSRNMQLTHEAKTRKKITKESLLARFQPKISHAMTQVQASSSTINSSSPNSDAEATRDKNTPLTTPEKPQSPKTMKGPPTLVPETSLINPAEEDGLLTVEEPRTRKIDKGKGKDPAYYSSEPLTVMAAEKTRGKGKTVFTQPPIKLRPPKYPVAPEGYRADSESDFEVVPVGSAPDEAPTFDKLPVKTAKNEEPMVKPRALAQLSSPGKPKNRRSKPSITPSELGAALRRRARQQAARERAEKIEELRRKGVVIQTAEERQQDQLAVEDMIEKARLDAEQLAKKEKEEVKKERQEKGEEDVFDSSDDEDYKHNDQGGPEDGASVDLSGSDEEENESDDDEEPDGDDEEEEVEGTEDEVGETRAGAGGFVDDIASEDDEEEDEEDEIEDVDDQVPNETMATSTQSEDEANVPIVPRRRKATRVIDEDEDEPATPKPTAFLQSSSTVINPFGDAAGVATAPMGLTQAFEATMADSQTAAQTEEDSLAAFGPLTAPEFPDLEMGSIVRDSIARDSPTKETQGPEIDLHLTQTQIQPDSVPFERALLPTQLSQIPDPSQDEGFEKSSPITSRFVAAPPSTIDTIIVPSKQVLASPADRKRGRLRRRGPAVAAFSDQESDEEVQSDTEEPEGVSEPSVLTADAFDILKKGSKKAKKREELFSKQKSEAKEMVEEQAVESEDEYAGIGGASDDSEGEEDEEMKKLVDESHVDVDERKIAAYFA